MVSKLYFTLIVVVLCLLVGNIIAYKDNHILGYKSYDIESDKICCLDCSNNWIRQPINTGSNGILVIEPNNENGYFKTFTGKSKPLICRFEVETGQKGQFPGLFAVIQKLNLRQNAAGECIDYVRMRPVNKNIISELSNLNINFKKNKAPWVFFCGNLSARRDGSQKHPDFENMAMTGFSSDNHMIEVEIYIDKIPLRNETLSLEILFTPFTGCTDSWSIYKECGFSKCIKKQNFNDGFVNCPFLNCPDEDGCDISIIGEEELRTKVTLTAVTSIFCSFFLFLGCIWCCRYFEMLCWSANTLLGRPNPVELSPMRAPSPTAPPEPPSPSKDLPPAYDALFPDRTNITFLA